LAQCRVRVVFMACKARCNLILPPFPEPNFFYERKGSPSFPHFFISSYFTGLTMENYQQCVIRSDTGAYYATTTVWEAIGNLNSITSTKSSYSLLSSILSSSYLSPLLLLSLLFTSLLPLFSHFSQLEIPSDTEIEKNSKERYPEGIEATVHNSDTISQYIEKLKCRSENLYNHTINQLTKEQREVFILKKKGGGGGGEPPPR
jgi:hypothetical protein